MPELKILPAGQLDSFFQMPFDAGESQGQIAGMLSGLRRRRIPPRHRRYRRRDLELFSGGPQVEPNYALVVSRRSRSASAAPAARLAVPRRAAPPGQPGAGGRHPAEHGARR
ncbi:MAG: hypothetical protein R3F11_15465 [Verrucomicrobiales bacterium]